VALINNQPGSALVFEGPIDMKQHIVYSLALVVTLTGCVSKQAPPENWPYRFGRALGKDLLLRLTDPRTNADFRIGIVDVVPLTGMLLGPADMPAQVEFLKSTSTFLWADAAEKIANAGDDEQLAFEFQRTMLTETNCPALPTMLKNFYIELENIPPIPSFTSTRLADPPGVPEEITVDGTYYIIQVMVNHTKLEITPDTGGNSALNSAAANLHEAAWNCANTNSGVVEQYFY
jgi:hypothetical protein